MYETSSLLLLALALGSWLLALGSWLFALGSWLLALGSWLLVLGSWVLACGSWRLALGSWLLALEDKIPSFSWCVVCDYISVYPARRPRDYYFFSMYETSSLLLLALGSWLFKIRFLHSPGALFG